MTFRYFLLVSFCLISSIDAFTAMKAAHIKTRSPFISTNPIDSSTCNRLPALLTFKQNPLSAVVGMDIGAAVNEFFQAEPFLAAFLACSFKASAADFLAQSESLASSASKQGIKIMPSNQTKDQLKDGMDYSRNLAFLLYGGLYQGVFLQFLYTIVYPDLFGLSSLRIPLSIFTDIFLFGPFVTLPVAYVIRGLVEDTNKDDTLIQSMHMALQKYENHIASQDLLQKYWMVWAPAQTINNCCVPEHLRVLFVAFVSFFWVYLLSALSSSVTSNTTEKATANQRRNTRVATTSLS